MSRNINKYHDMNRAKNMSPTIQSDTINNKIDNYLQIGFYEVEGWCSYSIPQLVKVISGYQVQNEIKGGVLEIGVHHGKFFIVLHNLTDTICEPSVAIDIFDNQILNIDNSGKGNMDIFQENIFKYAINPESISCISQDSTELSAADIVKIESKYGKFRIISIDGGHTAEHTINDFNIANNLICNGGVVILDDYYNQDWPGVHEGIAYTFLHSRPKLVPFLVAPNKLFFTTLSYRKKIFDLTKKFVDQRAVRSKKGSLKIVQMYGYDVISYKPN